MTLPQSGQPISASQINVELGKASNTTFSINATDSRTLAGITTPGSTIKYSNFYGKSSIIRPTSAIILSNGPDCFDYTGPIIYTPTSVKIDGFESLTRTCIYHSSPYPGYYSCSNDVISCGGGAIQFRFSGSGSITYQSITISFDIINSVMSASEEPLGDLNSRVGVRIQAIDISTGTQLGMYPITGWIGSEIPPSVTITNISISSLDNLALQLHLSPETLYDEVSNGDTSGGTSVYFDIIVNDVYIS